MLDASDMHSLALLYHLNSEPSLSPEGYEDAYEPHFKTVASGDESLALPRRDEALPLSELIARRRSCRRFARKSLALVDLAEILGGTYGIAGPVALDGGLELDTRCVPSAGALYPLELYLILQRVETVPDGIYHYAVLDHALEAVEAGLDRSALDEALLHSPFLEHANALVIMTAVFGRTLDKYAARGYRYILLEAGHAAQNLCLLAAERGLASLCVGGFMDAAINRFLGLEPRTEAAVYCVGLGHSS
jgi:SagB-type dehydrogenase family enzyme